MVVFECFSRSRYQAIGDSEDALKTFCCQEFSLSKERHEVCNCVALVRLLTGLEIES